MPRLQSAPPFPLINGHAYSFASIELKVGDFALIGINGVNYKETVDSVSIYGSDPTRIGRTIGKRKLTADLELQRREWDSLLPQLGTGFARKKIHVTVQYAETTQPVITDTIEGWITEVDSSNQEGTEPASVKLTLDPMEIKWGASGFDGMAAEAGASTTNGTFWMQDDTGIEGPTFAPNPWDTVYLGGQALPGICKVTGLPTLAFDKKKAGGVDGATITVNGYLPGPVEVEVTLWTFGQWSILQKMAKDVWRKPNKGKTKPSSLALVIGNKALELWQIFNVVVLGVSVPQDGTSAGTKIVKIKCVEFVAMQAVPRTATAKGAANVPLAPELNPARNQAGDPPSKTDIHPGGPARTRKGGVS